MEEPTKQEMEAFLTAGREFEARCPDYSETLHGAAAQGLNLEPAALREIVRLGKPELAYHLAKNTLLAHDLMGKTGSRLRDRIERLARDLDIKGTYAAPVTRRNDVDEYLEKRGAFRRRK